MKPFSLKRAIAGDDIITRSGKVIDEFYYFKTAYNDKYPIFVSIEGDIFSFTAEGKEFTPFNGKETDSELDLFMGE